MPTSLWLNHLLSDQPPVLWGAPKVFHLKHPAIKKNLLKNREEDIEGGGVRPEMLRGYRGLGSPQCPRC